MGRFLTTALGCAFAVSALAAPRVAFAQSDQPAEANAVVPPHLSKDSPAKYPATARRESVVVELIIDVDGNGAVTKAVVSKSGGDDFDQAALAAAKGLGFDPATRAARPIAARIRFTYSFPPPPARLVGRISRRATDSAIAGASVVVKDPSGVDHTETTAADGTFRVDNIPFGKAHIHVEAARNLPVDEDDDLAPGEETSLVFRLDPVPEKPEPAPAAGEEPVQEVKVKGERPPREVTKRTISRDEIFSSPGTNGDAIKSIQNLPGVARPPPFGGQLVVRGSAPQDTQTFIDGTNVPIIYHFGGLSSVVPSEAIDKIDFYPGNFGATFGRGMGGVIDVALRDPSDDGKLHAVFQYDDIDVRLYVSKALGKGWSFSVSGRRSYFDLWLKLFADSGISTAPRYYDYQAMVRKEITPDSDIRLSLFGSDDRLEIFGNNTGGGDVLLGGNLNAAISFWRAQLRYQNKIAATGTRITAQAAVGQDEITLGFGENYLVIDSTPISGRIEIAQRFAQQFTANIGIDMLDTPYKVTARFPRPETPGIPSGGIGSPELTTVNNSHVYMPGAYAEFEIQPFKSTRIVPGFRADYTSNIHDWNYSPRLTVRQDIPHSGPRTTFKGGAGLYYQPPQPEELDPVFGQKGLIANKSTHYSGGIEQELVRGNLELQVEGYYKDFKDLVVQDAGNSGSGFAYGSEWLLRWKNDPKMFGWIAYTLGRSERRDTLGQPIHLAEYDQTHILTLLFSRAFGEGNRIGGRFRFVSGDLYTPNATSAVYDVDRAAYQSVGTFPLYSQRLPPFHQLDIRFERRMKAPPLNNVIGYVDIENVYYYRAPEGIQYNYNYTMNRAVQGLPQLFIAGARLEL